MDRILIFAGTTEGRLLAQYLSRHGVKAFVSVATEYGEQLLIEEKGIRVHTGRLSTEEMTTLMEREEITLVIDATHPYAVVVSENIRAACDHSGREYFRLLRASSEVEADSQNHGIVSDKITYVASTKEAVEYLRTTSGNVLVTTGSKELAQFVQLPDYQTRIYARVLSTPEVVKACAELGFQGRSLICMQGPFCEELNYAMLKQVNASYMVTKESGKSGGFEEKVNAARRAGASIVLIGRPSQEEGYSMEELKSLLAKRMGFSIHRKISIIGIGMGTPENMTIEADRECQRADVLIGAKRILEVAERLKKPVYISYKEDEIKNYMLQHPEYERVALLLSGDIGFYSGAKKLMELFPEDKIETFSGISSVVYFCTKLHTSWEDVCLRSLHGREQNLIGSVLHHSKVFTLIGTDQGVNKLCEKLCTYGMDEVRISVGENLSYENERITRGTASELKKRDFEKLSVVLIENPKAVPLVTHGIEDEAFLRGKVPMTKSEIRSISLSKLRIHKQSVIYDVGAGTGSVSVEMALQAYEGRIYAIEKKPEAVALIGENKQKFAVDNLEIIEGLAPEALQDLPVPTHAFIGGSSGNLREIMELILQKNPKARMVINAIALETVAESLECLKSLKVIDCDIAAVSIGKSKEVGKYHMMMGHNPVYVISCTGGEEE